MPGGRRIGGITGGAGAEWRGTKNSRRVSFGSGYVYLDIFFLTD